jgi:hypothetical protein
LCALLRRWLRQWLAVAAYAYKGLIFVFFVAAAPSYNDALQAYIIARKDEDGVANWAYAFQLFSGTVGLLCGALLYRRFCCAFTITRAFVIGVACFLVSNATRIFLVTGVSADVFRIPNKAYIPVTNCLVSALSQVGMLPSLVLAGTLCLRGSEATTYTLFLAVRNAGTLAAGSLGAALVTALGIDNGRWQHMWLLIVVCSSLQLLPLFVLPFISLIPKLSQKKAKKAELSQPYCRPEVVELSDQSE